jgi:hypothetical protein
VVCGLVHEEGGVKPPEKIEYRNCRVTGFFETQMSGKDVGDAKGQMRKDCSFISVLYRGGN